MIGAHFSSNRHPNIVGTIYFETEILYSYSGFASASHVNPEWSFFTNRWPRSFAHIDNSDLLEFITPIFFIHALYSGMIGRVKIKLELDNLPAVGCWNKLRSKNPFAQELLRQIAWDSAGHIKIEATHIAGVRNEPSDSLSMHC